MSNLYYKDDSYVSLILSLRSEKFFPKDQNKINAQKLFILLYTKLIEVKKESHYILTKCTRSVLDFIEKNNMVSLEEIQKNSKCFNEEALNNSIAKLFYFRVLEYDQVQQLIYLKKEEDEMRYQNALYTQRVFKVLKSLSGVSKTGKEISKDVNSKGTTIYYILARMINTKLIEKFATGGRSYSYRLTLKGIKKYDSASKSQQISLPLQEKSKEMPVAKSAPEFRNFVENFAIVVEQEVNKRASQKALEIIQKTFNTSLDDARKLLTA